MKPEHKSFWRSVTNVETTTKKEKENLPFWVFVCAESNRTPRLERPQQKEQFKERNLKNKTHYGRLAQQYISYGNTSTGSMRSIQVSGYIY